MGMVNIEESELALLRQERNEARAEADKLKSEKAELTTKVETAEAAQKTAETERDEAKGNVTRLEDEKAQLAKRDERMGALGKGFIGKLGDTSKTVLTELAGKATDDEWELAVKEREEMAGVARDDKGDGTTPPTPASSESSGFQNEEVAGFMKSNVTTGGGGGDKPAQDGATSVRQLARKMGARQTAGAK